MFKRLSLSLCLCFIALIAAVPCQGDEVVLLDGTVKKGELSAIADGKFTIEGEQFELMGARSLTVGAEKVAPAGYMVELNNGSVLYGSDIKIADRKFQFKAYDQTHRFPIEIIRSVKLSNKDDRVAKQTFAAEAALDKLDSDRIFVFREGRVRALNVAIKSMDDQKLYVIFNEQERSLDRSKIYGIVFAHFEEDHPKVGLVKASTAQGDVFYAAMDAMKKGELQLKLMGETFKLPWAKITHVNVYSDRLIYLSDLKPERVVVTPLLALAPGQRSWFTDHAANSKNGVYNPIKLDGHVYDKGLCLLSKTQLEYAIPQKMTSFAAVVGIDDETGERGDCLLKVYLDGELKFEKRYKAADAKEEIKIPLGEARSLRIICDWADGFDGGDHLSLGDARFIRK